MDQCIIVYILRMGGYKIIMGGGGGGPQRIICAKPDTDIPYGRGPGPGDPLKGPGSSWGLLCCLMLSKHCFEAFWYKIDEEKSRSKSKGGTCCAPPPPPPRSATALLVLPCRWSWRASVRRTSWGRRPPTPAGRRGPVWELRLWVRRWRSTLPKTGPSRTSTRTGRDRWRGRWRTWRDTNWKDNGLLCMITDIHWQFNQSWFRL